MILSRAIRTSIVIAGMAVAACAQAQISLIVVSSGLALNTIAPNLSYAETVEAQTPALGLATFTANVSTATGMGTGTYSGIGGSMTIDIDYQLANLEFANNQTSQAIDGTWTYASGTGVFAGMTGGGTLSDDLLVIAPQTALSGTLLSGTLNAVPEPAPSAVIGAGVLGLCLVRRRKR